MRRTVSSFVSPLLLAALAACGGGDSTSTDGNISAQEKLAVGNALRIPAVVNAMLGTTGTTNYSELFSAMPSVRMTSIGTFHVGAPTSLLSAGAQVAPEGDYKAFGVQYRLKIKTALGNTIQISWSGVIGIRNLSQPTDIVFFGIIQDGTTPSNSYTATQFATTGSPRAVGGYVKVLLTVTTPYIATTGSMTITSQSYSGGGNCTENLNPVFEACNFALGTMSGSFAGTVRQQGGAAEIIIPNTTFSLPAVSQYADMDYSASIRTAFSPR